MNVQINVPASHAAFLDLLRKLENLAVSRKDAVKTQAKLVSFNDEHPLADGEAEPAGSPFQGWVPSNRVEILASFPECFDRIDRAETDATNALAALFVEICPESAKDTINGIRDTRLIRGY